MKYLQQKLTCQYPLKPFLFLETIIFRSLTGVTKVFFLFNLIEFMLIEGQANYVRNEGAMKDRYSAVVKLRKAH